MKVRLASQQRPSPSLYGVGRQCRNIQRTNQLEGRTCSQAVAAHVKVKNVVLKTEARTNQRSGGVLCGTVLAEDARRPAPDAEQTGQNQVWLPAGLEEQRALHLAEGVRLSDDGELVKLTQTDAEMLWRKRPAGRSAERQVAEAA